MKRVVAVTVLLALTSNCTYSLKQYHVYDRGNIIEFNNTVGDVIEAEEREQYDLFDNIEGFQEARFYAITDGGYEVEIVTDRGKYVAVNRDLKAIQILKDYFYRYNTPQYSKSDFEKKWRIVEYDELGFPITQYEVDKNIKHICCIGATAGFGLISLGLSAVSAFAAAVSRDLTETNELLFFSILIGGTLAGTVTGALSGGEMDRDRAIDAIKEARMPVLMR